MSAAEATSPMPMLSFALDYVRRGWPVFPCNPINKRPFPRCDVDPETGREIEGTGGFKKASIDPEQITLWWREWPNAMIGIPMGSRSRVWAIDPDAPKPPLNIDGRQNWANLKLKHGNHAHTHTHNTPGGGQHIIFKYHPDKPITNREGGIAKLGINVRGEGGYVIAPPSMIADGKRYEMAEALDTFNFAEAPDWLYDLILTKPSISERAAARVQPPAYKSNRSSEHRPYAEAALRGECDELAATMTGERNKQLNNAALKLGTLVAAGELSEGEVIGALYDAAIANGLVADDGQRATMATINSGLRKGYQTPREIPERESDASYGFMAPSRDRPDGTDAVDEASGTKPPLIVATPYIWTNPEKIAQRDWLYGRIIVRKFLSATVAPGGVGKSALKVAEALAMVTGKDLLGVKPPQPLRVWYWNLEDPQEETTRRIQALAKHYNLSEEDLGGRLFVDSGRDQSLVIAKTTKNGAVIQVPVVSAFVDELLSRQIDVFIIDPFVSCHEVGENDNTAIDMVAKEWARVCQRAGCAADMVHHTRKVLGNDTEVTAESSRGAKALTDACRIVRAINRMSKEEGERAGIEDSHRLYFRTFNDKANLSPPSDESDWFKITSVDLANGPLQTAGDSVGVVTTWAWPDAMEGVTGANVDAAFHRIKSGTWRESFQAKDWVGVPVAEALRLDIEKARDKAQVKALIKTWLANGSLVRVMGKDDKGKERPYVEVSEAAR